MATARPQEIEAEPAGPRADRFPSAYTILFALIVLTAILPGSCPPANTSAS